MTIADITLAAFTLCNSLRFAAYIPKITRAIRDQGGAEAFSFAAWSMFLISHASAMTGTLVDNEQWTAGFMFWGNVIGCSAMLFIAVATVRAARKSANGSAVPIRRTMGSSLDEVTTMATYKGECFCGAVQLEASGEPKGMGYCHCGSCRSWSGGPVNAFTLWKPGAVRVTAGASWHVPEDGIESAAMLQEMWRPFDDQSPSAGIGRCLCKYITCVEV